MDSVITAVREQDAAARFLAWPGDFDLDRSDHVEEVHLASGAALEGFMRRRRWGHIFLLR